MSRLKVSEVKRVRESFVYSPKKSVRKASRELATPVMSVWRVLLLSPYRLQLLQVLKPIDYSLYANFANWWRCMKMKTSLIVSSSVMNQQYTNFGFRKSPQDIAVHMRFSKIECFFVCAISQWKVYGLFFFLKQVELELLILICYLFPQLQDEPENFIWQQDGVPPHWYNSVRDWLNEDVPNCWIGRKELDDMPFLP